MRNKTKHIATLICMAVIAALAMLIGGCGGGRGGSAAAPAASAPVKRNTGFGKVSAAVKLTPPAGRAAGSTSATVTVSISISGVYKVTGAEFAPVETSSVIDYTAGSAKISMLDVPIGVNHLITVVADWGGYSSDTLKAIIPEVADGEVSTVTVDPVSTAIANAAIYITELEKSKLADFDPEDMAILQEGVAAMAKNNPSYYTMSGEQIVAYLAAAGIPAGVTLTPTSATVATSQTYQFDAALKDVNGAGILGATFTWSFASTASTTVGTVSSTGLFTATAEGSGILTASSGAFTATAAITVISNCETNTQCEDGVPLTLDTCVNPGTTSASCSHTTIACNTESECNDNNALTIDACANPGTLSAACSNTAIACNTSADCSGTTPICSNAATLNAACVVCGTDTDCNDSNALTLDSCVTSAPARVAGVAMPQSYPYCGNYPIACNTDTDCDDSNSSTTDTCANGGTVMAACSNTSAALNLVSIGDDHACALQSNGTVTCWGSNYNGATGGGFSAGGGLIRKAGGRAAGDGKAERKARSTARGSAHRSAANAVDGSQLDLVPVIVSGVSGATQIAAKGTHSCALISDGSVRCWGYNYYGQLGDGSNTNSNVSVPVSGLTGAVWISNNYDNTCAVINDGSVKCWGANYNGELGDGCSGGMMCVNTNVPVTVSGLSGPAVKVAVGSSHGCAIINDGTVQCWGYNYYGQLGNDSTSNSYVPVTVSGLSGAVAVTAGDSHTCAVINDGTMKCWGYNGDGELGDGTTTNSSLPVTVSGLSEVSSADAGYNHTCALLINGSAKCWGGNYYGELGVPVTTLNMQETPVLVTSVSGTIAGLGVGDESTCFALASGVVKCLGYGYYGQLGDGRGFMNTTPVSEFSLTGVTGMSLTYSTACAFTAGGSLSCFGYNYYGQLADGTTVFRSTPVTATASGFTSVTGVAVGNSYTCAISSGGSLSCVGYNYYGQLGDGTTADSSTPVAVSGLSSGVTQVVASYDSACALISGGTVKCWGNNGNGQIGDGTYNNATAPVSVSSLTGVTKIAMNNSSHTCALISGGTVKCWGYNSYGQLGDGTTNTATGPVSVSGLTGASSIAVSSGSSCALISDGTVKCWGYNGNGQLGDGTTTSATSPVSVSGVAGASAIAMSGSTTCAMINDGTVKCWGYNGGGQLGNNSTTNSLTPVSVYGITDANALYSGPSRMCANSASAGLLCWGYDVVWGGD